MDLLTFVKQVNPEWVLAPIYLKGARMVSGKEATGKNPLEIAFERSLNKDDALHYLKKSPESLVLLACSPAGGARESSFLMLIQISLLSNAPSSKSRLTVRRSLLRRRRMRRSTSLLSLRASGMT